MAYFCGTFWHLPGKIQENYEKPWSRYITPWLKLEHGISQI